MTERLLPLVGVVLFLGIGMGWRAWYHSRHFGGSGIALFQSGRWPQHVREVGLLVLVIGLIGQALAQALVPDSVAGLSFPGLGNYGSRLAVGSLLLGAGIVLMVKAQLDLGASWRVGIDDSASPGLVTRGLYQWSRNPIYVALFTSLAGFVLLLPTWISVVFLIGTVVGVRGSVLEEEAYLKRTYGNAYAAYTHQVGRFLPGLGTT